MLESFIQLDQKLFLFLNGRVHHPILDSFFPFITDFGNFQVVLAIAFLLLVAFGNDAVRKAVILAAIAVLVADLIGNDIKLLVDRLRPYWVFPEQVRLLGTRGDSLSPSFPSNHAINTFAASTVLAFFIRRWYWRALILFLAVLISYSRIYVGVHFPSDTIAGCILGILIAIGIVIFEKKYSPIKKNEEGKLSINWAVLTFIVIVLSFLYRYSVVIRGEFPLSPEEAQYWDWSRNLDWSYYSKPPLIAYLLRASTSLFGHTQFAVRGLAVTLALGMALITWRFGKKVLQDDRAVFFAILMLNLLPLYAVGALIMTTDTPLMLFWAATCYTLFIAICRGRENYWYLAGLLFGLGLLSKYAMIYIVPCLAIFLVLARDYRFWLRRKEPYLFLLIGFIMFLPVIYWSWRHDWVNLLHVAGQAKASEGFRIRIDTFGEFLGGQALLVSPALFIGMIWFAWSFFRSGRFRTEAELLFLVCLGAPVLAGLLVKSLQGNTLGNWAAPAYFTWTLFVVYEFFRRWDEAGKKPRRWLAGGAVAALLLPAASLPIIHERDVFESLHDMTESIGLELPKEMDPAYQMLGYDKLGADVSRKLAKMPQPERTFIFTKRYQEASELAFYVEGNPRTYNINFGGRRMNQYLLWPGIDEGMKGWDAIYVISGKGSELKPEVADQFQYMYPAKPVEIEKFGKEVKRFTYWRLFNFSGEFPDAVEDAHDF